jgi:hypothetical protein
VAIPCQGFTLTWGGQTLSEVQALEADIYGGELPRGRTTTWTPNMGTVRLLGFAATNLTTAEYGKRKRLTILARTSTATNASVTTLFDSDCIYSGVRIDAAANSAVRLAFTFRIQDTLDAPSNP